jgi:chromosome segregation ATPase
MMLLSLLAAADGQPPFSPPSDTPAAAEAAPVRADPSANELQDKRLLRLLARARRIDPDGQDLLRQQAFLRRCIERFRLRIAELQADGEIQRGRELMNRRDVQDRLLAMRAMVPADMERDYRALLKEFHIDDLTLDAVAEWQSLERRLRKLQEEIAKIEQQLDEHEERSSISLRAVTGASDAQWEIPRPPRRTNLKGNQPPVDKLTEQKVAEILDNLTGEKKP